MDSCGAKSRSRTAATSAGNVGFDSLFGASRDSGYTGPVTFESFSS
ncbi:MAG: hypothetical protein QOD31_2410, partial [Pseudonocardiales bacterium]|nr:hypothetical protein [Pseudonocardiales bacterium]